MTLRGTIQSFSSQVNSRQALHDQMVGYEKELHSRISNLENEGSELKVQNTALSKQVEEKDNAWKLTAAIMHLGEMTFKTKGREEGCEPDDMAPGERFGAF